MIVLNQRCIKMSHVSKEWVACHLNKWVVEHEMKYRFTAIDAQALYGPFCSMDEWYLIGSRVFWRFDHESIVERKFPVSFSAAGVPVAGDASTERFHDTRTDAAVYAMMISILGVFLACIFSFIQGGSVVHALWNFASLSVLGCMAGLVFYYVLH